METALSVVVGLGGERDTLRLGALVAKCAANLSSGLTICLRGGLGSGKTTLTRGLCSALPGGENAEVSSPSFTIVNIYPTRPEVIHMDLYRLEGMVTDDIFEECAPGAWDRAGGLTIIEWAEYLPERLTPADRLTLTWLACESGRRVRIEACGPAAKKCFQDLKTGLDDFPAGCREMADPQDAGEASGHGRGRSR